MWKYAIRKLLLALPVLLGITIIDYAIMCMAGSPLDMMISPRATQEAIAAKAQAPADPAQAAVPWPQWPPAWREG